MNRLCGLRYQSLCLGRLATPRSAFSASPRSQLLARGFHLKQPLQKLKAPQKTKSPKGNGYVLQYPERLLIYNAGTGRTTWIGYWKLATVFMFAFATLVQAPRAWASDEEPNWKVVALIAGGVCPMLVVGYLTAPFVNSIVLRLPRFARESKELLWRYSTHPPVDAELEIITVRITGQAKTTAVRISDLRPVRPAPGRLANFEIMPGRRQKRSSMILDLLTERRNKFYIGKVEQGMRNSHVPGVLENVLMAIRNRTFAK